MPGVGREEGGIKDVSDEHRGWLVSAARRQSLILLSLYGHFTKQRGSKEYDFYIYSVIFFLYGFSHLYIFISKQLLCFEKKLSFPIV